LSAIVYIYRGVLLLMSLLIPSKRQATLMRWKRARPHQLVYEIGGGILGIVVICAFAWMFVQVALERPGRAI
jgi:hypothetical protein